MLCGAELANAGPNWSGAGGRMWQFEPLTTAAFPPALAPGTTCVGFCGHHALICCLFSPRQASFGGRQAPPGPATVIRRQHVEIDGLGCFKAKCLQAWWLGNGTDISQTRATGVETTAPSQQERGSGGRRTLSSWRQ